MYPFAALFFMSCLIWCLHAFGAGASSGWGRTCTGVKGCRALVLVASNADWIAMFSESLAVADGVNRTLP